MQACIKISNIFECLSIPNRYGSTWSTYVPFESSDNLRTRKIPSAVPALNSQKFPTHRSSLWTLLTPPHISREKTEVLNGAVDLPDNKKFKQMQ